MSWASMAPIVRGRPERSLSLRGQQIRQSALVAGPLPGVDAALAGVRPHQQRVAQPAGQHRVQRAERVIQRGTVTVAGGRRAVATRTTAAATAAGSILGRPATFRPATRSVRTNVGGTADRVTPDPCTSPRPAAVRPRTACLVPPYSAAPGNGTRPASEAMLTTTPLP